MHLIYVCGFETIPALSNTSKLKGPAKIMNSFTLCTLKSYGKRKIWRRLVQSWVAKTTSQWSLALNTAGMFKHDWLILSPILATGCLNKLQGPTFWHVVYISTRCSWNYAQAKFKLTSLSHTSILSTSQSYKYASDKLDIFSLGVYVVHKIHHSATQHTFSSGCQLITWFRYTWRSLRSKRFLECVLLK